MYILVSRFSFFTHGTLCSTSVTWKSFYPWKHEMSDKSWNPSGWLALLQIQSPRPWTTLRKPAHVKVQKQATSKYCGFFKREGDYTWARWLLGGWVTTRKTSDGSTIKRKNHKDPKRKREERKINWMKQKVVWQWVSNHKIINKDRNIMFCTMSL
jgi:hypothetical protein